MTDFYLNNPNLKAKNVPISHSKEQVEEYLKCKNDLICFVKNYVTLDHDLINFELYDYQRRFIDAMHEKYIS